MHDQLFINLGKLQDKNLLVYAEDVGLNLNKFKECLVSDRQISEIRDDKAEGTEAGVSATPTFFLGIPDKKGEKLKVARVLKGAQNYARFREEIDHLLSTIQQETTTSQ